MTTAREFRLPDLGEGLTGAEIVRWLVKVGDSVAVDQPVVEVETAKAQVEVPCPWAGTVAARFGAPGEEIPVGGPLIHIATEADANTATPVLVGYGPSPEPRPPALSPTREDTVAPSRAAPGTGPSPDEPVPVASPLVRRLARERGVDPRRITGTGPGGLVSRADVERAAAADRVPLTGVPAAMADNVTRAHAEIPAATCWVDADATELLAARRATGLPLLALLARVCLAALTQHPGLNASLDADAREIVRHRAVHLGLATQTDRGTLVPVLRDAGSLPGHRLAEELTRLTERARAAALPPADLTGATFTLNNYGVFGVDGSTPLLQPPGGAMLGVGRVTEKPWAHDGRLALRHVVQLSLTFDHRVCDGGTAGGYLRDVVDRVEQPLLLLRDL
ncbi:dihydrolipoamide acetyltransferase family protein [Streptomyces litchfieldiae]|uniref:Dihydrolipoamide acetyltransferase component of pyruvate dehydrogenase complex n=1 Tax=Streptomyces litchfieldiae TaxID=3075543 RepID=A0ABU2MNJ9_9ACTN|nr:dihydrolipoamide acetyltransferase family protein [Streptomyces sp. DSM 44938]MDT0342234.1 dihydrolipoamide acetyltransferase family protein [Streptomyces sp. DSM 44938]